MSKVSTTDIQKTLSGIDYPANKQDLVNYAQEKNADQSVIELLEQLPEDREFNTAVDVNKAVGEVK